MSSRSMTSTSPNANDQTATLHPFPPAPAVCADVQSRLSDYLDGAVSGISMRQIADHLELCPTCAEEFALAARLQHTMVALGPVKAPANLGLKLRVAISQERARSFSNSVERLGLHWRNAVRPFAFQAIAGVAGAVLLVGGALGLLGAMGASTPVQANDEPLGAITAPHYLYSIDGIHPVRTTQDGTLVIDAAVNSRGEVYDYRVVSGQLDPTTQTDLRQRLASSVFQPASVFGLPIRGHVILTFSGISVHA